MPPVQPPPQPARFFSSRLVTNPRATKRKNGRDTLLPFFALLLLPTGRPDADFASARAVLLRSEVAANQPFSGFTGQSSESKMASLTTRNMHIQLVIPSM